MRSAVSASYTENYCLAQSTAFTSKRHPYALPGHQLLNSVERVNLQKL